MNKPREVNRRRSHHAPFLSASPQDGRLRERILRAPSRCHVWTGLCATGRRQPRFLAGLDSNDTRSAHSPGWRPSMTGAGSSGLLWSLDKPPSSQIAGPDLLVVGHWAASSALKPHGHPMLWPSLLSTCEHTPPGTPYGMAFFLPRELSLCRFYQLSYSIRVVRSTTL